MDKLYKKFLNKTIHHYKRLDANDREKHLVSEHIEDGSETIEFMVRNESRRRSTVCDETLDMRGKVPLPCEKTIHQNKIFWLDNISKDIFDKSIENNQGNFTIGAFEDIVYGEHTYKGKELKRQYKLEMEKRKSESGQRSQTNSSTKQTNSSTQSARPGLVQVVPEQVKLNEQPEAKNPESIPLNYYYRRKNERIQFVSDLILSVGENTYSVRAKNISVDGIAINSKTPIDLKPGDEVVLNFESSSDVQFLELNAVPYRVNNLEIDDKRQRIGLQILNSEQSNQLLKLVDSMVEACQATTKGRRKLDHEDAVKSAESLVMELVYTQSMSAIGLIIARNETRQLELSALCVSHVNFQSLTPLLTSNNDYKISTFQESDFLQRVYDYAKGVDCNDIIFAVDGKSNNDKTRVYFRHDFSDHIAWLAFVSTRRNHEQFRVFKVDAQTIQTLPKSKIKLCLGKLESKSAVDAKKLSRQIEQAEIVAFLLDVTYVYKRMDLSFIPLDQDTSRDVNYRVSNPIGEQARDLVVQLGYNDKRLEDRYIVELNAVLHIDDESTQCTTRDISVKGVCLKLDSNASMITKGMLVSVGFPALQKKVKGSINLNQVPYEVIEVLKADYVLVRLKRVQDAFWQDYSEFFRDLIERNAGKIKMELSDVVSAAKARLSTAMLCAAIAHTPVSVCDNRVKNNKSLRVHPNFAKPMYNQFLRLDENGVDDYSPFAVGVRYHAMLQKLATQLNVDLNFYTYKKINPQTNQWEFFSASDIDFSKAKALVDYLGQCMMQDCRVFKMNLARAQAPDDTAVNVVLDRLFERSAHHANKIRSDIEKVLAVGEIIDVTEILFEYYRAYQDAHPAK